MEDNFNNINITENSLNTKSINKILQKHGSDFVKEPY